MTAVPALEPSAVAAAGRALLAKETERVNDPHFIPEDRSGWHPERDPAADAPGRPYYDPESWRWFQLLDIGYADETILVTFRWTDPATPDLRYSCLVDTDGLGSPEAAAMALRSRLRNLLEPGWRDHVEQRWLSGTKVLVQRSPDDRDAPPEVQQRLAQRRRAGDDIAWTTPRQAAPR